MRGFPVRVIIMVQGGIRGRGYRVRNLRRGCTCDDRGMTRFLWAEPEKRMRPSV